MSHPKFQGGEYATYNEYVKRDSCIWGDNYSHWLEKSSTYSGSNLKVKGHI